MLQDYSGDKKIAGADEVYPLIVYIIIKGNIRKLKSNLSFIRCFRHVTRLESKEDYYYTTINTAIEFIEKVEYKQLNIKEYDFIRVCVDQEEKEMERMKTPQIAFKRKY
jgi:hypothetical protein